jgi:hypothetical protein
MLDELKISRRHLPRWTIDGAIYFVTFCTYHITFDSEEQTIIVEHIKGGRWQVL